MTPRRLASTGSAILSIALVAAGCRHLPPRPLSLEGTAAAFEQRSLDGPDLARFLERATGRPTDPWPIRAWNLRMLTLAALHFHPGLAVARAHAAVAAAAVETAGALPNPTLAVAPELSANPMGAVSPWVAAVHVDWLIETAGKRGHRIDRATAEAAAARLAVTSEVWGVRRELAAALIELDTARRVREALEQEVGAEERLVAAIEARLRAGDLSMVDVVPVRLALLQAVSDRASTATRVGEAEARVAAAIGLPVGALDGVTLPAGLDGDLAADLLGMAPEVARRDALLARADVRAALAAYDASEARLALELARQFPDLHLGPGYQFDQGQNKWSIGVSIDLPLLDRNEGPIDEAVAARQEAAATVTATQAAAIAAVERALARRAGEQARREVLLETLRAREANVHRSQEALAAGAIDRGTLIARRVEWARSRRDTADADGALALALVDLEASIEGPTRVEGCTDCGAAPTTPAQEASQ